VAELAGAVLAMVADSAEAEVALPMAPAWAVAVTALVAEGMPAATLPAVDHHWATETDLVAALEVTVLAPGAAVEDLSAFLCLL
jgi:hypothetical protein